MTPEQQRIAIAEACGWTDVRRENKGEFGGLRGVKPNDVRMVVPSYCRDLNAMHEVEKVLSLNLRFSYIQNLCRLTQLSSADWGFIHATAAQRAEAFLKTLNLWTP